MKARFGPKWGIKETRIGRMSSRMAKGAAARDTVMAEKLQYPMRVEQSKSNGWWYISVDDVPGLNVFGPSYEALLDQLKAAAVDLFHARGMEITDVEIVSIQSGEAAVGSWVRSEKPALQVN
jgi:predicted RNase H-like HicB family nuclease